MADYDFYIPVVDAGGKRSGIAGHIVAVDDAALTTRLVALATAANVITGGLILGQAKVTKTIDISAATLKATATADSDRRIKSKWTFRTADGYATLITVPTFADSTYGTAGGEVDLTVAQTQAFRDEILTGGYSTNRYEDITVLEKAVEAYG